jgi:hypothetical protein
MIDGIAVKKSEIEVAGSLSKVFFLQLGYHPLRMTFSVCFPHAHAIQCMFPADFGGATGRLDSGHCCKPECWFLHLIAFF